MSDVTKALALLATESWDTDEPEKRESWRAAAAAAATEYDRTRAEALRVWRVEDLVWDKLAADGEHGDEQLEMRLSLNLFSVMNAVDPDGTIFKKPYKTQPKVLEVERLRADNRWLLDQAQQKEAVRAEQAKLLRTLSAENAELRDAGGDLHFLHSTMGGPSLVAASKRWQAAVGTGALNGGELQRLQRENAELRERLGYLDKREPMIQRVIDLATADWDTESNVPAFWKARRALLEWTRANPKPGAGE